MDDDDVPPCAHCGETLCEACGECHECYPNNPRKCVALSDYMDELDRPFPEEYD